MAGRSGAQGRHVVALLLSALAAASAAAQQPGAGAFRIQFHEGFEVWALRGALRGASHRLRRPECRGLLSEFKDHAGRTLRENLARLGQTPEDYLALIVFADGSRYPRCQARQTLAFTMAGSRVVFVCNTQFAAMRLRDPRLSEAIVIHEALHSLGLGEDPPTGAEITRRVLTRCR